MINKQETQQKKLYFFFSLIVLLLIFVYIIFNDYILYHEINKSREKLQINPIKPDIIANVDRIKITNRISRFELAKEKGEWLLIEPRKIKAKSKIVEGIIKSLKRTSTVSIYAKDKININSFSLDNPLASIEISTKLDDKQYIEFGLYNSIDNTTYLTSDDDNKIYQIKKPLIEMDSLDFNKIIDSSVFSESIKNITDMSIYLRGYKEPIQRFYKNSPKDKKWKASKYNNIDSNKVDNIISKIVKSKAHIIIDNYSDSVLKFVNKALEKPLYKIKIKTKEKTVSYKVSYLLRENQELKIDKKNYVLVQSSENNYTVVVEKDLLDKLKIRYSNIKP